MPPRWRTRPGRQVALSLSDVFCVDRHRAAFRSLLDGQVDILFANESEICALYEVDGFEAAVEGRRCGHADGGVDLRRRWQRHRARRRAGCASRAEPAQVVDTTGAGDAYAAGFLAGLTSGRPLAVCGQLGSVAAAEIIGHYGARPVADLRALTRHIVG